MTNELASTLLYDPDPMVRRAAADSLSQRDPSIGESTALIEALVGALSDPHIAVQQAAANALLAYEPLSVSERILPLLHGNVQHRSIAVDILQQLGSASVPCLLKSIDNPDPHIRKFLTDILGYIGCAASGTGLLQLLRDSSPNVRAAAAEALGHVGGDEAVEGLMASIADEEEWVTFSVIQALGELRARQATGLLCEYLESQENAIQCAAVESLGKIGDPDVLPDLLAILPTAGIPLRHLLFVTIAGLVGNGSEVFQRPETREYLFSELIAALKARESEIQLAALKGIRLMGASDATGALLEYLRRCDSKEEGIRAAVLNALTEMGDETQLMQAAMDSEESVALQCIQALSSRRVSHAIPLLGQLVSHSDNREVRRTALMALGHLGLDGCEMNVVDAINDQSGFVRSEAAKVVAKARLKTAHEVLLARLNEESYPDVIVELVRAFVEINNGEDRHQLKALLAHPRAEVRAEVVWHWPWMDTEEIKAVLRHQISDADWRVRLSVVEKLALQGPDNTLLEIFLRAVSDPHSHVRQAAVTALGNFDLESSAEALYQALRNDSDIWVRTQCIDQLVKMNDLAASSLFIELLPTAPVPVQMSLARALGAFNIHLAIEPLEHLLSSAPEEVREAATWALEQIDGMALQTAGSQ